MTNNQNYQEKQQQEQEYQQKCSSSTTTTIPRSRACSSDPLIKMHIEKMKPLYTDLFGGPGIPVGVAQFFARLIRAGMEPGVIASAINATAWARYPTPFYMRAILQRYLAEGIMTEAQLDHERQERADFHHESNAEREEWLYY